MKSRKNGKSGLAHLDKREDGAIPFWCYGKPAKRICLRCHRSGQFAICPECETPTIAMDKRARPPKKTASKKKWREFFQLFPPSRITP